MENKWSDDIEAVLDNLRENCVLMSKTHKESYFFYKKVVKYFRIPTILLSSVGSVSVWVLPTTYTKIISRR
jgi:hypothetical protein